MSKKKSLADYTIASLFDADVDGSGLLTKTEIKHYFEATKQAGEQEVTQQDVDAFIASVDQNGDEKISRKELTEMIYSYYGIQ